MHDWLCQIELIESICGYTIISYPDALPTVQCVGAAPRGVNLGSVDHNEVLPKSFTEFSEFSKKNICHYTYMGSNLPPPM